MDSQSVLVASAYYNELDKYFIEKQIKKPMLICGNSFKRLRIKSYFDSIYERLGVEILYYSDFFPNPQYESVVSGVKKYNSELCDGIIAVGGGSAIDVAKCIKLFSNMNHNTTYLEQKIIPNAIPFLVVPTTAGTGSEATRFAVIYYQGEKQSVSHPSSIPDTILFDSTALKNLPLYQKKVTMLDALCHSVESIWSINSNEESMKYATEAVELILSNKKAYFEGSSESDERMLKASYLAGKAINITQTTAGHAMSYKLTTLYGISHGHAVALCNQRLLPYMIENVDKCIDSRGQKFLMDSFMKLARLFGCSKIEELPKAFGSVIDELELDRPEATAEQFEILKNSVNPDRLRNNPILLSMDAIDYIYHLMLLTKKD